MITRGGPKTITPLFDLSNKPLALSFWLILRSISDLSGNGSLVFLLLTNSIAFNRPMPLTSPTVGWSAISV